MWGASCTALSWSHWRLRPVFRSCNGVQVLLMGGPEYARFCGTAALEPLGLYLPGDENYPGDPFAWQAMTPGYVA